jgi:hypothetical protein
MIEGKTSIRQTVEEHVLGSSASHMTSLLEPLRPLV